MAASLISQEWRIRRLQCCVRSFGHRFQYPKGEEFLVGRGLGYGADGAPSGAERDMPPRSIVDGGGGNLQRICALSAPRAPLSSGGAVAPLRERNCSCMTDGIQENKTSPCLVDRSTHLTRAVAGHNERSASRHAPMCSRTVHTVS